MSLRKIVATSERVLQQLRHDPRTIALILLMPCLLLVILKYVFQGESATFNGIAPSMVGILPVITMFLVASVATLRERTSGTLDRLMVLPISKADFVFGYAGAFMVFALLQAGLASYVLIDLMKVPVAGSTFQVLVGAVLAGFLGMASGLFVSAFATSEFQAVQFMPVFLIPQLFTCGLFVPRDQMAKALQWLADVLPLTYAVDAMHKVTTTSSWSHDLVRDFLIVGAYGIGALILGAVTIRRQD